MKLRVRMQNGEEVEGRTEEWLAAVVVSMPKPQRDKVIELITKPGSSHILLSAILAALPEEQKARCFGLVAGKVVGYKTPGNYILHAESGHLNVFGGGLGGST